MKEIEWSELYGVGEIVCTCDTCSSEERFDFDNNYPDFRKVQDELKEIGWMPCKVNGKWHDFCCEKCRNAYIKEN